MDQDAQHPLGEVMKSVVRLRSQWHPSVLRFSSHFSTQNPDMLFWWHFAAIPALLVSPF